MTEDKNLRLTPEDEERLKNGETVTFSHHIDGYRLSVSVEEIEE